MDDGHALQQAQRCHQLAGLLPKLDAVSGEEGRLIAAAVAHIGAEHFENDGITGTGRIVAYGLLALRTPATAESSCTPPTIFAPKQTLNKFAKNEITPYTQVGDLETNSRPSSRLRRKAARGVMHNTCIFWPTVVEASRSCSDIPADRNLQNDRRAGRVGGCRLAVVRGGVKRSSQRGHGDVGYRVLMAEAAQLDHDLASSAAAALWQGLLDQRRRDGVRDDLLYAENEKKPDYVSGQ